MSTGFPADSSGAHRFLNRSDKDVLPLAVGDHSESGEVNYPDVDKHLKRAEGLFHKDGRKYE